MRCIIVYIKLLINLRNSMEVITIDSIAYLQLKEQLNRIEGFIERVSELYHEVDDNLEMTTKEVMETLSISESTLYRWRKKNLVCYHYTSSGDIRYMYNSLFMAIRCSHIRISAMQKEEAMKRMNAYKDNQILKSYISK